MLVTLATFNYPAQAHLVKAKLAAAGIKSFVADEMMTTWLYPTTTGGVRLQIDETDVDQAREILSQRAKPLNETDFNKE
jgi:hypothetical protein